MKWHTDAACRGLDPSMFFPEKGDTATATRAKQVCAVCPVATECLADAHASGEGHGIRGGLAPRERGQRDQARPPRQIRCGTEGGYLAHIRRDEPVDRDCLDAHHTATARRGTAA